jgi:hypothetical protein
VVFSRCVNVSPDVGCWFSQRRRNPSAPNLAGQAKPFRSQAKPLAGHPLSLIVVFTNAEMFLKVFLCVLQIVLGLDRNHGEQPAKKPDSLCFILKQNDRQKLVEWQA